MATRRVTSQEKTQLDQYETRPTGAKSNTSPAVPADVIAKLLAFTFAMITLPIGSYFLSLNTIYGGNTTYAGATAAFMANVVLVGYVLVAFWEDKSDREAEAEEERKKTR